MVEGFYPLTHIQVSFTFNENDRYFPAIPLDGSIRLRHAVKVRPQGTPTKIVDEPEETRSMSSIASNLQHIESETDYILRTEATEAERISGLDSLVATPPANVTGAGHPVIP